MSCPRSRPSLRQTCSRFWLAGMSIVFLAQSGCHQRAYNELYVENMASEIRLLEDRVYEYDAEYRALENELEDLRLINEGLENRLREAEQAKQQPRVAPKAPPPSEKSATPAVVPKEPLKIPSSEELQLEVESPEPPAAKKPPNQNEGSLLPPKNDPKPSDAVPLLPPPASNSSSNAPRGLPSAVSQASFADRRIDAPSLSSIQPAMATVASTASSSSKDDRVRGIDFHPGLCRGLNADGQPGDEGIVLVLVPRNSQHEFVAATGQLTIVVEESVEGQTKRLGRWEFSPEELAERIEPVGSGQGIHLQLPWQEATPETKVVEAFVRFTDDTGITMVNHRQIHLRKPSPGQSTWTPR